jgi:cysteine desulfurase
MSPVLHAMGLEPRVGLGAIRFSVGRMTDSSQIDSVAESLKQIITTLTPEERNSRVVRSS